MSQEVDVEFEVRSMDIMKDTLTKMEIEFSEIGKNEVTIKKSYNNITINSDTGRISYDEGYQRQVDEICQQYMVNWYKDRAIREGNEIQEEVMANGEVHLHVLN